MENIIIPVRKIVPHESEKGIVIDSRLIKNISGGR